MNLSANVPHAMTGEITLPRTACSFLAALRYASACACGERSQLFKMQNNSRCKAVWLSRARDGPAVRLNAAIPAILPGAGLRSARSPSLFAPLT
ncbi:TPA: hypothetical protein MG739_25095 [Klebsiella pneumoniae]|nr:hypothetical protein [Klebsiella pneumoniae]HBZ2695144.1 hypothetical protein [Klebsiella pneumoniae]